MAGGREGPDSVHINRKVFQIIGKSLDCNAPRLQLSDLFLVFDRWYLNCVSYLQFSCS